MTRRSVALAERAGARTLVIDAADYPAVHPQLTPFLLIVPLQWFTVFSALLRGITDLDARVFMGRRILATGPDATWP
jgi:fructoselysine-6-P-deglycase FrlB-like protein